MRNNLFKDAAPEDTVKRIKAILKKIGIPTEEQAHINNSDLFFSLMLYIKGFEYRVNGKAVTDQYALASAYGELMERLQNQLLWPYVDFRPEAKEKYNFTFDLFERVFEKSDIPTLPEEFKKAHIYSEEKNLYALWQNVRKILCEKEFPVLFIPYYSLNDDRIVYLPRTFVFNIYGSNGMAAGNTAEEALTQGLSEILERYVSRSLYFEELTPPTIPKAYLQKNAPFQFNLIKKLEDTGLYKIIVKDCSLDKQLPVVATIIKLATEDKYVLYLGASPIWQIALERCLTEAFQGQQLDRYIGAVPLNLAFPFEKKMDYDNHMNIVRRSKGQYPPSIFGDAFDYEFNGFPETSFRSQKEMMKYLINLIRNLGYNIYVRDVSFTKFNAYQIIVPGMSEIKMLSKRNWREVVTYIPVNQYLNNLGKLSDEELYDLSEDMENSMADESRSKYFPFSQYFGLPVGDYEAWQKVTLQLILALINHKLGKIKTAYNYMVEYTALLDKEGSNPNFQQICASRDYLLLSSQFPQSPQRTRNILKQLYDVKNLKKLSTIFEETSDLVKMLKEYFHDFELPECWNCEQCFLETNCRYRELEEIYLSIKTAVKNNPVNQLSVRDIVFE